MSSAQGLKHHLQVLPTIGENALSSTLLASALSPTWEQEQLATSASNKPVTERAHVCGALHCRPSTLQELPPRGSPGQERGSLFHSS